MKKMWIRHSLCAASLGLLAMPTGAMGADEESPKGQDEQRKSKIVVIKAQDEKAGEAKSAKGHATFTWTQDNGDSAGSKKAGPSVVHSRDGQVIVLKKHDDLSQADHAKHDEPQAGVFRFELKLDDDGTVQNVEQAEGGANPKGVFRFLSRNGSSSDEHSDVQDIKIEDGEVKQRIFLKRQESDDDGESSASDRRFRIHVQKETDEDSAADSDAQDGETTHGKHQYRVMVLPEGGVNTRVFRWHQEASDESPSEAKEHAPKVMIWKTKDQENENQQKRIEIRVEKNGDDEDVSIVELDEDGSNVETHGNVQIIVVSPDGNSHEEIHEILLNKMGNADGDQHVQEMILRRGHGPKRIEAKVLEGQEIELEINENHEFRFEHQDELKSEKQRVRVFMHRQEEEEADDENETEEAVIELKGIGGVFQLHQQDDSHGDKEATPMIVELNQEVLNQDGKKALAKLLENEDLPKEVREMIKKHIGDSVQLRKIKPGQPQVRRLHIEREGNDAPHAAQAQRVIVREMKKDGEPLVVGRVLGTDLEHKIVENVLQWHSKDNEQASESETEISERMEEIEAKLLRLEAKIDRLLKDQHN